MKKGRLGFTITELLLVIAILVILVGASVPAIISIQGRLEQRRLDDFAREIFVAAQNQLSARVAAGTLSPVEAASESDGEELSWLTNNEKAETLLEGDATVILETGSHCMIKYNPDTATVLEVYYAQETMDKNAIISGVYSDEHGNRTNERKDKNIGYFRGSDAQGGRVAHMTTPTVTVDNGEELKVKVSVPVSRELGSNISYKVTLTVQQLKANGQSEAGSAFQMELGTGNALAFEKTVILDSLAPNQHFYQLSQGKVTPGSNIMVTATVSYISGADRKMAYLASSASARTNSLFAGLDSTGTAKIANGRQLQNLDKNTSNVSGITVAAQTEIINWALRNSGTQSYYAQEYPETYTAASPLYFQPIANSQLSSYDGKNNEIQCIDISLPISGAAANAGLFASMAGFGAQLKNIALLCPNVSNPSLSNSASVSTGALAGTLSGATVTNCRCYGANGFVYGNSAFVGGLIGRANDCVITNSFAQLYYVESDCGKTVGGLIGSCTDGKVEYSYANIGAIGFNSGTGLNEWISDYGLRSPGKTVGGTYSPGNIGGLIGSGSGQLTINNCYSCGFAGTGSTACGLVGYGSAMVKPISNSYSVLSYGDSVTTAYGVAANNVYYDNNTAYWMGGRSSALTIGGKNGYSASTMLTRPGTWVSAGVSYPYGGTLYASSAVYPYPMIKDLPHYGDWPSPEAVPTNAYIFSKLTSEATASYRTYTVNSDDSYYVTLEQIPGNDGANYNQKTLTAYAMLNVNGSESTPHAVVWQIYTGSGEDNGWTTISSSQFNYSYNGKLRATLRRDSGDTSYSGNSTGGSLVIVAADADEYANETFLPLRVRSVLSTDEGEWARVNVKIMPQLRLSPVSDSVTSGSGGGSTPFTANRRTNDLVDSSYGWTPQWLVSKNNGTATAPTSGVSGGNTMSYAQSYGPSTADSYFISLSWGPYVCNATLVTRTSLTGTTASCTGDGMTGGDSTGAGDYYCVIEKGSHRNLSFSWSGASSSLSGANIEQNISGLNGTGLVTFSAPTTVSGTTGSMTYDVTGNQFSDGSTLTAQWKATSLPAIKSSCDIYVVGIEPVGPSAKTTDKGGSSVSFQAAAHFPANILSSQARTYTWWTDANDYISVAADSSPAGNSAHTTVLKANTSGGNVNVNVYCKYSVGSTRFSYTQVFTVTIPSMTQPALEKCLVNELVFMPSIAGAGAESSWIDPALSGMNCQLTAGSSIYLKASDAYIRSDTDPSNISYYTMALSESSSDIEIHSYTGTDHISYFRIDTVAAPGSTTATATVTVGPWTGTMNFSIGQPSISASAYIIDSGGQTVSLTANTSGYYECYGGTDMYLRLSGLPDLSGLAVSGLVSGQLSATVPALDYATKSYDLCLSAGEVSTQSDVTLTITTARYPAGLTVTIRLIPGPAPLSSEPPTPTMTIPATP